MGQSRYTRIYLSGTSHRTYSVLKVFLKPKDEGDSGTDGVPTSMSALEPLLPWLDEGGRWKPSNCTARHRVAVVVPYRDRYCKNKASYQFER